MTICLFFFLVFCALMFMFGLLHAAMNPSRNDGTQAFKLVMNAMMMVLAIVFCVLVLVK